MPTDHTPSHKLLLRGANLSNSHKGPVLASDDSDIIPYICMFTPNRLGTENATGRRDSALGPQRITVGGTSGLVPVVSLSILSSL